MEFESEYARMRTRFYRVREQDPAAYASYPIVPERLVRCVWYDRLYDAKALKTLNGEPVEALDPGEWNRQEGPDFLGAVVRIGDNAPVRGDVEIHVRSGDWRRHGHQTNPRYNGVVLHVVLWHDGHDDSAPRQDGTFAPHAALLPALREDIADIAARIDLENYPFCSESRVGACHTAAAAHPEIIEFLLRMAGRERLMAKARRFSRELTQANEDEVIYHGFMEGLGYRNNKNPFRKLTDLAPLKTLRPLIVAIPAENRAIALQSIMLGLSGLHDNIPVDLWDEETINFFKDMRLFWDSETNPVAQSERLRKTEWIHKGVRPANYPARRIAGMCQYLADTGGLPGRPIHSFRESLLRAQTAKEERAALESLVEFIAQNSRGYWENHITVGSRRGEKAPALIGSALARTLVLNTVLPVLLCRAHRDRSQPLADAVFQLYDRFPCLETHQISRLMMYRLWGTAARPPIPLREAVQQGLIQIFFDYCDENIKDCDRCVLPHMIRESAVAAKG